MLDHVTKIDCNVLPSREHGKCISLFPQRRRTTNLPTITVPGQSNTWW